MKRSTTFILGGGLLLGTIIWWMFLMSPERSSAATAREELSSSQVREATIRTQIAQLADIIDNEISYRFAIGEMETAIPLQPQADVFLDDLTFVAESTGVEILGIGMSLPALMELEAEGEAGLEAYQVTVTITANGQYFEVLGFLYGLEAMDRLVRVDTIGLTPGEEPEEPEEPPEETDDSTTTTSTTIAEPRLRPEPDILGVDITMRIFTRSGAGLPEPAVEEAPQEGPEETPQESPDETPDPGAIDGDEESTE